MAKLLEYSVMALSSEDLARKVKAQEITEILTAIRMNQPKQLSVKNHKAEKKKTEGGFSLALIRSDGKKRKFFLKDDEVRKNLNKRQQKLLEKAQSAIKKFEG